MFFFIQFSAFFGVHYFLFSPIAHLFAYLSCLISHELLNRNLRNIIFYVIKWIYQFCFVPSWKSPPPPRPLSSLCWVLSGFVSAALPLPLLCCCRCIRVCWILHCLLSWATNSFCWNTPFSSFLRGNAFSKRLHVWKCLYCTLTLDSSAEYRVLG